MAIASNSIPIKSQKKMPIAVTAAHPLAFLLRWSTSSTVGSSDGGVRTAASSKAAINPTNRKGSQ
jgi:hypothetical protein